MTVYKHFQRGHIMCLAFVATLLGAWHTGKLQI